MDPFEFERRIAAAEIVLTADESRISDVLPFEIRERYKHTIRSRGAIEGHYYIETIQRENPSLESSELRGGSQIFGVALGDQEMSVIVYDNNPVEGPTVSINANLLTMIDTQDIDVFDLTEYDEMAGLIFGFDYGYSQPGDIQDSPNFVPLMHSAIRWVIDKKALSGVETEFINYILEMNGDLLKITTLHTCEGNKIHTFSASDGERQVAPDISIIDDGEEIHLTKPTDPTQVKLATSFVVSMIENGTLIH